MAEETKPEFVLLPGLDGTGDLFEPFCAILARARRVFSIARLPTVPVSDYGHLADQLSSQLDLAGNVLVAESFSGPLAIELAARQTAGSLAGLVLVASFVRSPVGRPLRWLPWQSIFRVHPPDWAIRRYLVGADASGTLVEEVRRTVSTVSAGVLAQRIRLILAADARPQLKRCSSRVLYLQATMDRLVRQRSVNEVRQARADVTVARIETSHLLLQTKPEAAWAAIHGWLATTELDA